MKPLKISTIIIGILFFTQLPTYAERIYCKKYSGSYMDYNLTIIFSKNGKMLIEVEQKSGGGYFSTPGSYTIKNKRVDFFYRGLTRSIFFEEEGITATPYTFSISEDYQSSIELKEDKAFPSLCK